MACDTDSRTSVALARIILKQAHGIHPEFVALSSGATPPCDARLLIGDKVVCEEPPGFEHQLDLGAAWKQLTGLPFVFAVWTTRAEVGLDDLPQRLETAKRRGLENVREIIERYAVPRGWPAGVALQYLTAYLKYDIGPRQIEAMKQFYELAGQHGLIASPPRTIELYR